ncbi:MAG: hypothetical protein QOK28_2006 [Actinomycetota bacterium]|jgi:hypothetical protein
MTVERTNPGKSPGPFEEALMLLVLAVVIGGGSLLWLAVDPFGYSPRFLLFGLFLGALFAIGFVVTFVAALWKVATKGRSAR